MSESIPAQCYGYCNSIYIEGQATGNSTLICEPGSAFQEALLACEQCVQSNGGDSSKYIEPKFAQMLEFCNMPLDSSTSSIASPTVTYITGVPPESLTTIVESQIVDVTVTGLDNKVITGVLMAATVVRLKDAVITTSASVTGPTTSAASLTPDPTPPASKAWIAGPVIGAVFLVLLLLAGFWFIRRRKKRRAAIPTTTTDDVDNKEKYAKAELHAEHTPRPVPMELEGSYPDPVPEMSVNEVPAQEMYAPEKNRRVVSEMSGRHL